MKRYLIELPYYRKGAYYPAGSIVSIPADEKPARSWKLVEDAPAPAEKKPEPKPKGRASDKDVA